MHLVTVTSSLINQTVHNTDIQQLVPESLRDVHGTVDAMLDDAFIYGRGWISASVCFLSFRLINNCKITM